VGNHVGFCGIFAVAIRFLSMLPRKLFSLFAALLLKASSSAAQTAPVPPPAPPPAPNEQQVTVPVPRAVSLLADVVGVLVSRNEGQDKVQTLLERRRERSRKGPQTIDFKVPKNRLTRALGLSD
jgi:hypothetical protein